MTKRHESDEAAVIWIPEGKYAKQNSQCKGPGAEVYLVSTRTARRPNWLEWRKQKGVLQGMI